MDYSIISIGNPKREVYKANIRKYMTGHNEIQLPSIDGRHPEAHNVRKSLGLKEGEWGHTEGEMGVWLSHFFRWDYVSHSYQPLLVFEDDAIIGESFVDDLNLLMEEVPDDWDFVSLWVPDNQHIDYTYDVVYNGEGIPKHRGINKTGTSYYDIGKSRIAKVYQGYGLVATLYSPQGGKKLVTLADQRGLSDPVDCFMFQHAHAGRLNGYAPKPLRTFVQYDWPETTR